MKRSLIFSLTNGTGFFKQICLSSVLKKKIHDISQSFLSYAISLRSINSIVKVIATGLPTTNMHLILWQELCYWCNSATVSGSISYLLYGKCW